MEFYDCSEDRVKKKILGIASHEYVASKLYSIVRYIATTFYDDEVN
jgi:hypothetical protein